MWSYSTSIGNSFQPCAHMYTITCGQPESFCWSEKYFRSLEAPLVHNSTWRGKSNASLYLSSLITRRLSRFSIHVLEGQLIASSDAINIAFEDFLGGEIDMDILHREWRTYRLHFMGQERFWLFVNWNSRQIINSYIYEAHGMKTSLSRLWCYNCPLDD